MLLTFMGIFMWNTLRDLGLNPKDVDVHFNQIMEQIIGEWVYKEVQE